MSYNFDGGMVFENFEDMQEVLAGLMQWDALMREGDKDKAVEFLTTTTPRVRTAIAGMRHNLFTESLQGIGGGVAIFQVLGLPQDLINTMVSAVNAVQDWMNAKMEELQREETQQPSTPPISEEENQVAERLLHSLFPE